MKLFWVRYKKKIYDYIFLLVLKINFITQLKEIIVNQVGERV